MSFEALKILPNGLRVWRSEIDTGLVLLQLNVMVGFQNEVENNILEFCHCNEHMAAKWTSVSHPSASDNTLVLSEQSIETNAFTTIDMTGYYMKGLVSACDVMVDLFTASFTQPQYDASVFDAEMSAVQNELGNIAAGTWYGHDLAQRGALYAGTPLAVKEKTKIENVQRLRDSEEGMAELLEWRENNYDPKLCTLFVCGAVPEAMYQRMLQELGSIPSNRSLPAMTPPIAVPPATAIVAAPMDGRNMHRVSFIFDATTAGATTPVTSFSFHERAMLDLISSVLSGAGLGARLYRRLRTAEKLIYAVSSGSSLEGCGRLRGKFIIDTKFQITGETDARAQLRRVVAAVMDEIGSLAGNGVTAAEMRQWGQAVKMNEVVAKGIRESKKIAATSYFEYVRFVIPQLTYWSSKGALKHYLGCAAPRKLVDHSAYVRMLHDLRKSDVDAFARQLFSSQFQIVHTVP